MSVVRPIQCVNCSEEIGNLEGAFLHQNSTVCEDCYNELTGRPPKKRGLPVLKILFVILLLACGTVGVGYFMENTDVGGYGLFAGIGCLVLMGLTVFVRILRR